MHIIFDLDGTLIDSANAILKCYEHVLSTRGLSPLIPLNTSLIGPPLAETLKLITGEKNSATITSMVKEFSELYDRQGYMDSGVYPHVSSVLHVLKEAGHCLYIVTNKRVLPSIKIIEFMGWSSLFLGVYSKDSFNPLLDSKSDVINAVLEKYSISRHDAFYVGDRSEDAEAATTSGLKFCWVSWGYGDLDSLRHVKKPVSTFASMKELEQFFCPSRS